MKREDFIELLIEVVLTKDKEIYGDKAEKDVATIKILPSQVESYREDLSTDEDPITRTVIGMKSGVEIAVITSFKEFEKLLYGE